jgi:hypothetical protein
VWLGLWAVLEVPSPKFHCQEAGVPAEVSVNCTDCPVAGEDGPKLKDAESGAGSLSTVCVWQEMNKNTTPPKAIKTEPIFCVK